MHRLFDVQRSTSLKVKFLEEWKRNFHRKEFHFGYHSSHPSFNFSIVCWTGLLRYRKDM